MVGLGNLDRLADGRFGHLDLKHCPMMSALASNLSATDLNQRA